jgi:hypothetical protein
MRHKRGNTRSTLDSMPDRKYAGSTAASVEYAKKRPDTADSHDQDALLAIYLNDHLAGAVAGSNLAKRLAEAERDWVGGAVLPRVAKEIEEDLGQLTEIMAALEVPARQYKMWAGWAMEKVGRLKPNGRLLTRSPLSRVVELEAMRLGVEGKAAGWRTLRARAATDSRLDAARLDELIARARRQIDDLERLRVRAAVEAFGGSAVG